MVSTVWSNGSVTGGSPAFSLGPNAVKTWGAPFSPTRRRNAWSVLGGLSPAARASLVTQRAMTEPVVSSDTGPGTAAREGARSHSTAKIPTTPNNEPTARSSVLIPPKGRTACNREPTMSPRPWPMKAPARSTATASATRATEPDRLKKLTTSGRNRTAR